MLGRLDGARRGLVVWLVGLAVIAAPVALLANALGLGKSPVAASVMVVWIVLVLGWISERKRH